MNGRSDDRGLDALRRRAEHAMDEGRGRRFVEPLLERILRVAPDGHAARLFAHRHLAELRLELDPWSSALHLRKVIAADGQDDVSHSLMALAQALLGNFRAAVSSYRRALTLSPHNPWYHHNLGHLLDVALDRPEAALPHLELALRHAVPPEHEIVASAAHCFARVGELDSARELAEEALSAAPHSEEHQALLRWIELGAPADQPIHPLRASARPARDGTGRGRQSAYEPPPQVGRERTVIALLERNLADAGFSATQVERAKALWSDYSEERELRVKKPEICAAAVHYAIALVHGIDGVTQASIARRYGVPRGSVSSRYGDIRQVLSLTPRDPRYDR